MKTRLIQNQSIVKMNTKTINEGHMEHLLGHRLFNTPTFRTIV